MNEHIQSENREENDEVYEEYNFEGDYEEYGFRCQECNQEIGENEELYEEYIYEGNYEQYRFRCQKCGQERKTVNTRNDRSIDETFFQKLVKRKWWLLCMILVLVTVGTVAGLSIHLIEPITRNEAVVILSTRMSSNVPMVITSTGESQRVSELPVSIG